MICSFPAFIAHAQHTQMPRRKKVFEQLRWLCTVRNDRTRTLINCCAHGPLTKKGAI